MNIDDETRLFYLARAQAPDNGASSRPVARLRAYLHQQLVLNETPDADTADVAGRLLDAIEEHEFVQAGDYLTRGGIPWNVLVVSDADGTQWYRQFGSRRYDSWADGEPDETQVYDWATEGGRATTEGLFHHQPLRVLKVARRPGQDD